MLELFIVDMYQGNRWRTRYIALYVYINIATNNS